jgi:galactitol-specific phosphotransferase system IIB component
MQEIGLTDKLNKIELRDPEAEFPRKAVDECELTHEDPDGNIKILVYTLDATLLTIEKKGKGKMSQINAQWVPYYVTRYKEPKVKEDGSVQKYHIPPGVGTAPWISPNIVKAFKEKKQIDTIVITEGYIKAISGWLNGLHIFGLSSITHYREKETGKIHSDIIRTIVECKVKNVILLYDGDCLNISLAALADMKDLYKRPSGFFSSARNIKDLLKDYLQGQDIDVYFSHVNTDTIEGNPKGLDDVLVQEKKNAKEVIQDLLQFSKPGFYFHKENITYGLGKLQKYFHIDSASSFYTQHQEIIKQREFVYYGTKYRWDDEKSEVVVIVPGAAKNYFRVGDYYYERLKIPNKYGQFENVYHKRQKSTITDDHGPKFVTHVAKYKAFCNVPDHVNYQDVIHHCYNSYAPFEHEPSEDLNCDITLDFMKHIFGEQCELGLDYVQMLYQKPTQILPILCLVSKENKTGKSTFAKWLKAIFTQNMTIVGNSELENEFNASYASRLVVCCDEAFIDKKKVIERIKSLATADKIVVNAKGKDHIEIDFFGKFILLTNNEENFVYASEEDQRYWVRKVPVIKTEKKILPDLIEEIPSFLNFLNNRNMHTKDTGSRMFFSFEDIKTDSLERVIQFNKPTVEREIRQRLRSMFIDFGTESIYMTLRAICKDFFKNKYEDSYVERILKENLKAEVFRNSEGHSITKRHSYPKWDTVYEDGRPETKMVIVKDIGRPYIFLRESFLTAEEISSHIADVEIQMLTSNMNHEPVILPGNIPGKQATFYASDEF